MGNVYSIGNQKNLIIYSCGQYIYLRIAFQDMIDRPIILATDYKSDLYETIYNTTLHYSYTNQAGDIVIKSILETNVLHRLPITDSPDCINAGLTVFNNELVMLYLIKNPLDDTYILKCALPFTLGYTYNIYGTFHAVPRIKTIPFKEMLYIIIDEQQPEILGIDTNYEIHKLLHDRMDSNLENEISSRYTDEISRLNSVIMQQNDIIESIKLQYNELMDTATKYRDEAIKWRGKFYK